ncbi:hypothetical protein THASP1DRAFT_3617, partial [Thamnocephalis sphaerospora]
YMREETSAACQLFAQMTSLIAYYMQVKLPFTLVNCGAESWTWRMAIRLRLTCRLGRSTAPLHLSESNGDQFTRGFAMLCYDVSYLCHQRGLPVSLELAPAVAWNLWRCCRAP